MDSYKSKVVLRLCFLSQILFPFRFMLEACVHFDFWNIFFFILKSPYDLRDFSFFNRTIKNLKNDPNVNLIYPYGTS